MSKNFELLKTEGRARRGVLHTVHGDIQTPVFMNVGTCAAIKGGVSTMDLRELKCQVGFTGNWNAGGIVKHLSFARKTGRQIDKRNGRNT